MVGSSSPFFKPRVCPECGCGLVDTEGIPLEANVQLLNCGRAACGSRYLVDVTKGTMRKGKFINDGLRVEGHHA